MKRTKKIISALLVVIMTVSMLPLSALPVGAAGLKDKTIVLGSTAHITGKQATNVYYGTFDGNPIKWRTLQNQNGELYLLSDRVLRYYPYNDHYATEDYVNWSNSDLRVWLNNHFYTTSFSRIERAAISTQNLKNIDSPIWMNGYTDGGPDTRDNVFVLSYSDLGNTKLFNNSDPESADISRVAYDLDGDLSRYWIRTPHHARGQQVIVVDTDGDIRGGSNISWSYEADSMCGVRPAFYLRSSDVIATSPATGGKISGPVGYDALTSVGEYSGVISYKLTVYDPSRSDFSISMDSFVGTRRGVMAFSYTGAKEGENEFVSMAICSKSTGEPLYYGRLVQNKVKGSVSVYLPADIANGEYTVCVYSEQINADYQTDYASRVQTIDLTVADSANIVTRVEATVPAPVAGGGGAMGIGSATVSGSNYFASVINWYVEKENGECGSALLTGRAFVADKNYYADVKFTAVGSTVFSGNAYGVVAGASSVETLERTKTTITQRVKFSNLNTNNETKIHEATALSAVPIDGYDPPDASWATSVGGNKNYTVRILTWYEIDPVTGNKRYLDSTAHTENFEFRRGHRYELTLEFVPKAGYQFASDCEFYINQKRATRIAYNIPTNGTWCSVELDCVLNSLVVERLTIEGITPPVAGETASFDYTIVERDAFSYEYISWQEYNTKGVHVKNYYVDDETPLVFKNGYRYRAFVYLDPSEQNSCYYADDLVVTMNGSIPEKIEADYNYGYFVKDFGIAKDKTAPITEVNIFAFTPRLYTPLSSLFVTSQTEGCSARIKGWFIDKPLLDVRENDLQSGDGLEFEYRPSYIACVVVEPNYNRELASDVKIYINGVLADRQCVFSTGENCAYLVIPQDLVRADSCTNEITKLRGSLNAPRIGMLAKDAVITVPQDANYTAEIAYWVNADNDTKLLPNEPFMGGTKYKPVIAFRPNPDYKITGGDWTIDGMNAFSVEEEGSINTYGGVLCEIPWYERLPGVPPDACMISVIPPKVGELPDMNPVCLSSDYEITYIQWYYDDYWFPTRMPETDVFQEGVEYAFYCEIRPKYSNVENNPACFVNWQNGRKSNGGYFASLGIPRTNGVDVSGWVRAYDEYGLRYSSVKLFRNGESTPAYSTSSLGNFLLNDVAPGSYTMRVGGGRFLPCDYKLTVGNEPITSLNYEIFEYGDANCDGIITTTDYSAVVNAALSNNRALTSSAAYNRRIMDTNSDGFIDVLDCVTVERRASGHFHWY